MLRIIPGIFFLCTLSLGHACAKDVCRPVSVSVGKVNYQGCVAGEPGGKSFKGIQYALADRWKKPVGTKLTGDVSAKDFGKKCIQAPYKKSEMSEQCLYLNVWSPVNAKNAPVMVFIHGGAFLRGAGSLPLYNGAKIAKKRNIVVVTLNYRLGILGFLYNEQGSKISGNYGLQDQQEALKWVNRNIGAFGGDPGKVTLVGESAGAKPIILGQNVAEATPFTNKQAKTINDTKYTRWLAHMFGVKLRAEILNLKRYKTDTQTPLAALNKVINDSLFFCSGNYVLGNVKNKNTAFGYTYEYVGSYNFFPGIEACDDVPCHGAELPFVFANAYADTFRKKSFTNKDKSMLTKMGNHWGAFIKTNTPGTTWEAYQSKGRYRLKFPLSNTYDQSHQRNCDFWKKNVYEARGGVSKPSSPTLRSRSLNPLQSSANSL